MDEERVAYPRYGQPTSHTTIDDALFREYREESDEEPTDRSGGGEQASEPSGVPTDLTVTQVAGGDSMGGGVWQ